jgi:hypothetical protein
MKRLFVVFGFLFLVLGLFAQAIVPPETVPEALAGLDVYLGSLAGVAALSVFITALISRTFTFTVKWLKRVVSWLVPIIIVVIGGWGLNFGFLANESLGVVVLYGLAAGLVSNGIFSIDLVTALVNAIEGKAKK